MASTDNPGYPSPNADSEALIQVGYWHSWGGNKGRFYYLNEIPPFTASLLPIYIEVAPNDSLGTRDG
jgi:hypothetical protein